MKFWIVFLSFFLIGKSVVLGNGLIEFPSIVYESNSLKIVQVSEHAFCHTSYLQTTDFGRVPCNGMILIDENEALVFDTPADSVTSVELIEWIHKSTKAKITGVVATHFHNDCLGGLNVFHQNNISSYGSVKTIALAERNHVVPPQIGFRKKYRLNVGTLEVLNVFIGEGHTSDNIVSYCEADQVLFGGCLIKELNASKGYLGDANLAQWSKTVVKVKQKFRDVKCVIPGHGAIGSSDLFDYTIKLFEQQ